MSILSILDIGNTALLTAKRALETTSHNIANANTVGYSRQDAVLTSIAGGTTGLNGNSGRGVSLTEVTRLYDSFTTLQLRSEKSNTAYWDTYSKYTSSVEGVFNETGDNGIAPLITKFFNDWQQVAQNPQSTVQRAALLNTAGQLASRVNLAYSSLSTTQSDILKSSQNLSAQANTLAQQIYTLNEKIAQSPGSLDLMDQRDLAIEQLNQIVKVSTIEGDQGRVSVYIGGTPLVDPLGPKTLAAGLRADGTMQYTIQIPNEPQPRDVTAEVNGGQLKANLDARDTTIAGYINQLNTFATDFSNTINGVHTGGFDLNGSGGGNFFNDLSALPQFAARDFSVAITDPRAIAASASLTGVPGDNVNAQAIADLANATFMTGGRTPIDFYREIVSAAAIDSQAASINANFQQSLVQQLESKRQETSGVNLDEEAVNLVKYQKAFEAAARMIAVGNSMLDDIIAMVR